MTFANETQITPPRVSLVDERTGAVSREWYRWFYSLYNILGAGTGVIPVDSGGTGLGTIPTNGQLLIGNGTDYTLNTLGTGVGILVTNGLGTITVANTGVLSNISGAGISVSGATGNVTITNTGVLSFSAGTTGLTPATATTGVVTLAGKLVIANGGTNSTSTPTAGAVPYGTGTAYAFTAAGTAGQVLTSAGAGVPTWTTPTTGTVTSVGLAMPVQFAVTNSPVTSSGTLTAAWNTQSANVLLAGPASGAGAVPTFRALTTADLPALPYGTGTVTSVALTLPSIISVSGSPITTSGTLAGTLTTQSVNSIFAGPSSGAAAAPTFRALTTTDIPSLSYVTSVGATAPITTTGGLTPTIGVTAAALTKTDDTNVTATLGGSPTTALLAATSLTLGWTGQLAVSRGGTGVALTTANFIFAGPSSGAAAAPTFRALTTADIPALPYGTGTVTSVAALTLGTTGTDLSSTVANGTTTPVITLNVPTASASNRGALSSTDWTTFNNKGSVTSVSFTGGLITVATATTTPALTVAGTSGGVVYFSNASTWASSAALTQYGVVYGGGAGAAPVATAAGTTGQVLTATTGGAPTWANPATSGTVTSVSVVSANGLAGTVATPTTTPAITLSTSITGILKGNGTAISAAVANTDYVPLSTVITKTADYTITGTDTWIINNKTGSALTLTFPAASSWTGRYITVKNMQAQAVNSASSNIVPIDSTTAGTAILLGVVGNWATMVSDGTNWIIMQAASNNNLLLE